MLTGPYTMLDWSYNEAYPTRRDAALALAEVVRQEAEDLDRAGAKYIQIDEPAIHARPEELAIAIEAMGIVTQNLRAKTISHICYGDFAAIYPGILDLPVDQLDLALANYDYRWLDLMDRHPFTKEMAIGIVDVHTHELESVAEAADGIRKGLKYVSADKLLPHPDCGLKTRPVDESIAKRTVETAKLHAEARQRASFSRMIRRYSGSGDMNTRPGGTDAANIPTAAAAMRTSPASRASLNPGTPGPSARTDRA